MNHRQRKKNAKRYALNFMCKVLAKHPYFKIKKPPVIRFYKPSAVLEEAGTSTEIAGSATAGGRRIFVYGYESQTKEELYTTLRHEMLHAILMQAGEPARDSDTIFALMAELYNAAPYIVPPTLEKDIREVFEKMQKQKGGKA